MFTHRVCAGFDRPISGAGETVFTIVEADRGQMEYRRIRVKEGGAK